jgi:hypothetical protein
MEGLSTMNEQDQETRIADLHLLAPRITPADIDAAIVKDDYYRFPGTTVTVCALTLVNGYVVIGHSAAASPDNFDESIGKNIAYDDARNKVWPLEGYLLREGLHNAENTQAQGPGSSQ